MARCIKCNYELVLLSNRPRYKCSICSKLFPKKQIEAREFRTWNKWQREIDIKELISEELKNKAILREKKKLKAFRLLFKKRKHYNRNTEARESYYQRNKEKLLEKRRQYYQENHEKIILRDRERYKEKKVKGDLFDKENRVSREYKLKLRQRLVYLRNKQKRLAVVYLENDEYRASTPEIFSTPSAFLLSDLLIV